jgi:hypothetical protein
VDGFKVCHEKLFNMAKVNVKGTEVTVLYIKEKDCISLTGILVVIL